jgi:hypothetical protein
MKTNFLIPKQWISETAAASRAPNVAANGPGFVVDWQMAEARVGAKKTSLVAAGNRLPKPEESLTGTVTGKGNGWR